MEVSLPDGNFDRSQIEWLARGVSTKRVQTCQISLKVGETFSVLVQKGK